MGTLYLDRRHAELQLEAGRLRVRHPETGIRDLPIALLERVVITAGVTLDTNLLAALGGAGVAVLILNPRNLDRVAFVLGRPHNDVALRLSQYRHLDDSAWQARWAHHLVTAKLRGQRQLLGDALTQRPDLRRILTQGGERLDAALARCTADAGPESLRGQEGAAAAGYFQALGRCFLHRSASPAAGAGRRPIRSTPCCRSVTRCCTSMLCVPPMPSGSTPFSASTICRLSAANPWPPTWWSRCGRWPTASCGGCLPTR